MVAILLKFGTPLAVIVSDPPLLASNVSLKRIMEKAKKEQVPGDIIKRAIDKVNSGASEDYEKVTYEIFIFRIIKKYNSNYKNKMI